MIHCFEINILLFSLLLGCVLCIEHGNYDYISTGFVVANIKRRDTIPLQPGNRRWINGNSLNYRRTKDIREHFVDRHFEITEAQLREAQREAQIRNSQIDHIREGEIKSAQLRGDQIRNGRQTRDNAVRNAERRENLLGINNYNQRNTNYGDKDQLDKLQREMRWLTIDTDEGIGI